MIRLRKDREALALVELSLALVLIGILMSGFFYMRKAQRIEQTHIEEMKTLQSLSSGLPEAFEDIVKTYSPINGVVNDGDSRWGWNKNASVSPFPGLVTVGGTPLLRFSLSSNIGGTQLAALKKRIVGYFKGGCEDWTSKAGGGNNVFLRCEGVTRMTYELSNGSTGLAIPFALGAPINGSLIPTAIFTYNQRSGSGDTTDPSGNPYSTISFSVSYGNVFLKAQSVSANRISKIRRALESFTNATKIKEVANPQNADGSGGLNSADDEFVGWHWKALASNVSNATGVFCNKSAGTGQCTNFNSNVWYRLSPKKGLVSRRIIQNLMGGDTQYYLDGFGNGIYIYPTAAQCTGSNYFSCIINPLPVPADNAVNNSFPNVPPFTSIVYTEPFGLKSVQGTSYGKIAVVY